MAIVGYYFYKNNRFGKIANNDPIILPPAISMKSFDNPVLLKCMNLKNVYLTLGTMFWCFTVFFIIMVMSESKNQEMALQARGIIDWITDQGAWKFAPFAFVILMLYFYYSRTEITWNSGILIAEKPADILYFEIKKVSGTITIIYLQSKDKLWILVPATLEETKKFKDMKVLHEQLAFNETQIVQLKTNLIQFGIPEKKYNLITKYLVLGIVAFILTVIWIMVTFA